MIDVFHNIPVLYEDNHLLVVDKPAGLLVQEDHTGAQDLLTVLKEYLRYKYDKPGNVFLALVHRLDRPVSGVMILAKTSKCASRLSDQIRRRTVSKLYQAVVEGKTFDNPSVVHYLIKDHKNNKTIAFDTDGPERKLAKLSYTTLKSLDTLSLVNVNLITGRPHQIRVQLAAIGHPLWGDRKYGTPQKGSVALRCVKMEINHPTKNVRMTFEARLPDTSPWNWFT